VASGLKPLRASEIENRLIRGPARMAEIFALLPEIRRRLPAAQLPFQRPAVAVFPDSDKIGVWPNGEKDQLLSERASGVGYWHGEA